MTLFSSQLGTSVPNWQLLSTQTPAGVASITFSGLSGYSKYRLNINITNTTGTSGNACIRINGDTTSGHYLSNVNQWVANSTSHNFYSDNTGTGVFISGNYGPTTGAFQWWANVEIDNALILSPKNLKFVGFVFVSGSNIGTDSTSFGAFFPTPVITSITFTQSSGTATYTGTVYLEGAN